MLIIRQIPKLPFIFKEGILYYLNFVFEEVKYS